PGCTVRRDRRDARPHRSRGQDAVPARARGAAQRARRGRGYTTIIRDQEVLEALRGQPELLSIADAVTETQQPPRASRRRVLTRSAAVVAVGAAVLIAVLLWPSGGKRNPILERALAAIGDGPVMHVVLQTPSGFQLVELSGGRASTTHGAVR